MVNWLVVGIGDITTRRVIPAIQAEPRSTLYGVLTRDPEKGKPYAEHVWTDLAVALRDPAINAVYVASPVFLHAPQTIQALWAGKHVLCEKPMAMDLEQATAMVTTAQERNRLLGIAYYRRFYPKVRRAQELLRQGAIGQPVLVYTSSHSWFDAPNGFRGWLLEPEKAGGGPLYDVASHRIDLLSYLFGRPLGVCAHLSNIVHDTRVEDSATVIIDYETAVRGIIDVRWHSRIDRDEFRIIGTDGEMDLTPLNSPTLRWNGNTEELSPHANLHYPLIEDFVAAVLDGKPLVSSGATARWTDWVTEEAVQASTAEPA